jgi:hypothetical protein
MVECKCGSKPGDLFSPQEIELIELTKESNKWRSKALMRENRINELEAEVRRMKGQGYE